MYRIELAPGEEALFKSIDEMAAGIANGVITSQARIWHQTSGKWLPIEFHPHYKIALTKGPQVQAQPDYREAPAVSGPAALAATPPIFEKSGSRTAFSPPPSRPAAESPVPKPLFSQPPLAPQPSPYAPPSAASLRSMFEKAAAPVAAEPELAAPIDVVMHAPETPAESEFLDASANSSASGFLEIHHAHRPRGRTWTVGLLAAGAVVLLGGGAIISALHSPRPAPAPVRPAPISPASYGAQPTVPTPAAPVTPHATRPTGDSVVPAPKADPTAKIADAPHIADAPKLTLSSMGLSDSDRPASDRPTGMTPALLVSHYSAAYEAARAELDRGIRLAGLGTIFAASRLAPGNVSGARSSVAGAANLVRIYRQRSAAIEQTYRDSVNLLTRQIGWTPGQIAVWENRSTQIESPELAALANQLLDAIDGTLEVLGAHEGGYDVAAGTITFREAQATRDYSAARHRLATLVDRGADSGTPAGRILRALGSSAPPQEKTGS